MLAPLAWIACSEQPAGQMAQEAAPQSETSPFAQPLPEMQMVEGTLANVDTARRMISIQTPDGTERRFSYSDETAVQGADNTVEGLAKVNGDKLRVLYESQGPGSEAALRIEVVTEEIPTASGGL
jgi:hypothetical protein